MKITEKLLKELGCEKSGPNSWILKSRGYHFYLQQHKKGSWAFHTDAETLEKGWNYGHSITDIEEAFGFIAEDLFDAGKKERSTEIRELLGIKMEGKYSD